MKVLVTGGAGYIGSTTCSALLDAGHTPVILDSLVNGRPEFVRGRLFYEGDIADEALVQRIFREHPDIAATIHFAALIVVPDSVARPYDYYQNNVAKSLDLFRRQQFGDALRPLHRIGIWKPGALGDVLPFSLLLRLTGGFSAELDRLQSFVT